MLAWSRARKTGPGSAAWTDITTETKRTEKNKIKEENNKIFDWLFVICKSFVK